MELEIYIFVYFKGLKLSYFQIFLVKCYQDDVDETKSFDVIYHPPLHSWF